MKKTVLFGAAIGLSLMVSPPAIADDENGTLETATSEMTEGEKRLAKLTDGRIAGKPVNCIRTFPNDRLTVINDTAYVYGRGGTIYVQRTKNPDRINRNDVLVSRRFGSTQLCRQDVVTTVDPLTGIFTGAVFFEDFIPYTRIKEDEAAS